MQYVFYGTTDRNRMVNGSAIAAILYSRVKWWMLPSLPKVELDTLSIQISCFARSLLLFYLCRSHSVLIFLFVSSQYCNINTAFLHPLLLHFFILVSLFCNLVLHRFTCSLNAFARWDVTKATMHNLLIYNNHFSFLLHSFWLVLFHIVSFVFCCSSLFYTTFVWRIKFEILKFNRCEKNTDF